MVALEMPFLVNDALQRRMSDAVTDSGSNLLAGLPPVMNSLNLAISRAYDETVWADRFSSHRIYVKNKSVSMVFAKSPRLLRRLQPGLPQAGIHEVNKHFRLFQIFP